MCRCKPPCHESTPTIDSNLNFERMHAFHDRPFDRHIRPFSLDRHPSFSFGPYSLDQHNAENKLLHWFCWHYVPTSPREKHLQPKKGMESRSLIEIRNRNQRFVSTRSSRSSIVALSVRNGRRSGLGLWQSGSQDEGSSYFSQLFSRELKTSYVSLPALSPINRPGDGTLNVQEKSQRSGLLSEMFQPPSK